MTINFKAPKGTQDILPNESSLWQKIENLAFEILKTFNFKEIRIPTFENENLFCRSVGDSTDVVEKEMFTFTDRAGRPLALRPEGTASVVRAILEHGLVNETMPLKLFYIISCFRNERPQAGRFKEFHQLGIELFGAKSPIADVEVMVLINQFFNKLQLKNLSLKINSIGCKKCRSTYKKQLIEFYEQKKSELCPTCLDRLQKNPIRLLDCKVETCAEFAKKAPKTTDNLCAECEDHFEKVCSLLKLTNLNFEINNQLVRGLDYYTKTVFEFTSNDLGSQNAICGGGRYDSLVEELSSSTSSLPAFGCAIGLERLIMILKAQNQNSILKNEDRCALFIGNFKQTTIKSAKMAFELRERGLNVEVNLLEERSTRAQMKFANKINADFSCILGENELDSGKIQVKNMLSSQVFELSLSNFTEDFIDLYGCKNK